MKVCTDLACLAGSRHVGQWPVLRLLAHRLNKKNKPGRNNPFLLHESKHKIQGGPDLFGSPLGLET